MRRPVSPCLNPPLPSPPLQGNACKKAKTAWVSAADWWTDEADQHARPRCPRATGARPGQQGLCLPACGQGPGLVCTVQAFPCGFPLGLRVLALGLVRQYVLAGTTDGRAHLLRSRNPWRAPGPTPCAGLEQEVRLPAEHALSVPQPFGLFCTGSLHRHPSWLPLFCHTTFPLATERPFAATTDARHHGERGHCGSSSSGGRPAAQRQRRFRARCRQAQPPAGPRRASRRGARPPRPLQPPH